MYEEEEKRGFPLRDLIVKLIVAVVFVLLLVWLLPKVDLTGLNNRIFKDIKIIIYWIQIDIIIIYYEYVYIKKHC